MRRCENCNVEVIGRDKVCPLCGARVGEDLSSPYSYPIYKIKHKVLRRVLITITIASIVIALFINAFTYKKASYPWVAVMAAGVFILWFIMGSWLSRKMSWGAKVYNTYAGLAFTAILVDISSGWHGWSVSLALPIAINADIITLGILMLCGKKNYRRFFSYFIISLLMSILPPFLYLFGLIDELWVALSALLTAFISFLVILCISPTRLKAEWRKRFHL